MRLLFLSSFYPPHDRGGFEQLCDEVAVLLRQRGHTVSILTTRSSLLPISQPEPYVTRTLYLQADVDYYRISDFFFKRAVRERANARALRTAIERAAPDLFVVWGMWNLSRNLPYWAEQWLPGRVAYYIASTWPCDVDIHEEYWQLPARRPWGEVIKRLLRALARSQLAREHYPPRLQFEHAVCVSQYIHTRLVNAGQLPGHSGVVYNGIDPEPFVRCARVNEPAASGPLRLLYLGSLVTIKGVDAAIEAMGLLKQRGLIDRVQLTITGDGHPDYEARLHAMTRQLDVSDHVRFTPRIPRSEVPAYLPLFDVYLFTSCGPEAMARAVMEAMASGLLVIGAEIGGQVEMLRHDQNALTFQPGDARGLADSIARAIEQPALREQLARAGQQTVLERFTVQRMVDELEVFFAQAAASADAA